MSTQAKSGHPRLKFLLAAGALTFLCLLLFRLVFAAAFWGSGGELDFGSVLGGGLLGR